MAAARHCCQSSTTMIRATAYEHLLQCRGNQPLTLIPLCPCFWKQTCGGSSSVPLISIADQNHSSFCHQPFRVLSIHRQSFGNHLSSVAVSIGFGSKLSTCQTPPFVNSQITAFAFGAKCGLPAGGCQTLFRTQSSRCNIAPKTWAKRRASRTQTTETGCRRVSV